MNNSLLTTHNSLLTTHYLKESSISIISQSLVELQKSLQILPGIGEKTAQRLAYFLVNQPKEKGLQLADAIKIALDRVKPCSECFLLSDTSPCAICSDISRNSDILCIVESSRDVFAIENTKEFHGYYFVLGNLLSPINGIGPNEIRIKELSKFLSQKSFKEIILALSPSTEGETTMQYLGEYLQSSEFGVRSSESVSLRPPHVVPELASELVMGGEGGGNEREPIKITRLSTGIPYGSDMEYTASTTLLNAMKRRHPLN